MVQRSTGRTARTSFERFAGPARGSSGARRAGLVLVDDGCGPDPASVAERLAAAGYVVLVPDLREPGAAEHGGADLDRRGDRAALADLDLAVEKLERDPEVDPRRIGALGLGAGGTLAFLLGCHSRRVAAAVDLHGPVRRLELNSLHPVQPLEMSLNLSCPLLAAFGERDPSIPPADVDELRARLAAFAKTADVRVLPGPGRGNLNPLDPAWDASAAEATWDLVLAFLGETLAP